MDDGQPLTYPMFSVSRDYSTEGDARMADPRRSKYSDERTNGAVAEAPEHN